MSDTDRTPATTRVAFLGLGAMGARMARRVLDAGFDLTVWNRSPARAQALASAGAGMANTPAEAAAEADVVVVMVRDDEASRQVWTGEKGALGAVRDSAVAVDCSTLSPGWIAELGGVMADHGLTFIEAPVVGTRPHAEGGVLNVLAGGDPEAVGRVRPVLDTFAGAVHHAGPLGAGSALKLAVNGLFALQVGAIAEWLAAFPSTAVSTERAVEILAAMPTTSPAAQRATELMVAGHSAPNFPIELVRKDLGYASDVLRAAGVEPRITDGAADTFGAAVERELGDLDIVAITRLHAPDTA